MKLIVEIDLNSPAFRTAQPETQIGWAISTAVHIVRQDLRYNLNRVPPFYFESVRGIMLEDYDVGSVFITESLFGDEAATAMRRAEHLFGRSVVKAWLIDGKDPGPRKSDPSDRNAGNA